MTPEIQVWMARYARPLITNPGRVLEVGSLNVNGTVRQYFKGATEYIGTDMQGGDNVDLVLNNHSLLLNFGQHSFDTIIACEVLEHDVDFLGTLKQLRAMLKYGGHLIITTPTFGFPLHRYPFDFWRFGEDAYRQVFFKNYTVLDLRHLNNAAGPNINLAGIARFGDPK